MHALDFCYWLQGFTELNGQVPTEAQWTSIKEHLNTVFNKVTPPVQPWTDKGIAGAFPVEIKKEEQTKAVDIADLVRRLKLKEVSPAAPAAPQPAVIPMTPDDYKFPEYTPQIWPEWTPSFPSYPAYPTTYPGGRPILTC